jgi:hypothetical protein
MLVNSFYVTTQEIDHPNREHSYRLSQGEPIPDDHYLKTQRKAGEFKLSDTLSQRDQSALAKLANSL